MAEQAGQGDTIAAVATAPGRAGVAVVRVSGAGAFDVARRVAGREPVPGAVRFAKFRLRGKTIDEGLLLAFKAPKSFTGEDVVEFQCHGGAVAPRRILDAAIAAGARLAAPGEFTKRAFLSGRISLDKAQSVIDLIDAKTERAADAALDAASSTVEKAAADLYRDAIALSAEIEHALDIDEGELPPGFAQSVFSRAASLRAAAAAALRRVRERRILRDGALVVLLGAPNAGKSSLFNALAGTSRAIVSPVPGTTRDFIETWLDIDGWPVRLVDTAGLRAAGEDASGAAPDQIELEGIRRSEELASAAQIAVLLSPGGKDGEEIARRLENTIPDARNVVRVASKCDAEGKGAEGWLAVSSATGEGLDGLRRAIAGRLEADAAAIEADAAASDRADAFAAALVSAVAILGETGVLAPGEDGEESLVLAGNDLRRVCETLAPWTGGFWSEDLIASLFSRFCVGK